MNVSLIVAANSCLFDAFSTSKRRNITSSQIRTEDILSSHQIPEQSQRVRLGHSKWQILYVCILYMSDGKKWSYDHHIIMSCTRLVGWDMHSSLASTLAGPEITGTLACDIS